MLDDWTTKRLGEVAHIKTGERNNQDKSENGKYPFFVRSQTVEKIDSYNYECEAVIIPGEGNIGEIFHYIDGKFDLHQRVYKVSHFSPDVFGRFVYFAMAYRFGSHALRNTVKATVDSLRLPTFKRFEFPVPSDIGEQRGIATALSEADALIESFDRLIAKKRAIKQAAMQRLLTGETRLPGFGGGWQRIRLGEVASFGKGRGLTKSDLSETGFYPCIHYGELFTEYGEKIENIISRTDSNLGGVVSRSNEVLMPTSDVTPTGLAVASCIRRYGVVLGGDILIIRVPERTVVGEFLAYKIRMERDQIMQLVSGTTVFHIYASDMAEFVMDLPSSSEQEAIIGALTDMATEIESLQRRREKARQIKQGMMQELLTGRTRLVEPQQEAVEEAEA